MRPPGLDGRVGAASAAAGTAGGGCRSAKTSPCTGMLRAWNRPRRDTAKVPGPARGGCGRCRSGARSALTPRRSTSPVSDRPARRWRAQPFRAHRADAQTVVVVQAQVVLVRSGVPVRDHRVGHAHHLVAGVQHSAQGVHVLRAAESATSAEDRVEPAQFEQRGPSEGHQRAVTGVQPVLGATQGVRRPAGERVGRALIVQGPGHRGHRIGGERGQQRREEVGATVQSSSVNTTYGLVLSVRARFRAMDSARDVGSDVADPGAAGQEAVSAVVEPESTTRISLSGLSADCRAARASRSSSGRSRVQIAMVAVGTPAPDRLSPRAQRVLDVRRSPSTSPPVGTTNSPSIVTIPQCRISPVCACFSRLANFQAPCKSWARSWTCFYCVNEETCQ